MAPTSPPTRRPAGIVVLVIVYIVLSLLSLVWSLLVFGFGGLGALFGTIFGAENMAMQGTNRALSGTLGLITAVLHLVVAYGLWNLKRWAWLLAVVALGVYVLTGIIGMFSGGFWALCCGFAGLAVPVAIFVYLLRPDVRGAFMNR